MSSGDVVQLNPRWRGPVEEAGLLSYGTCIPPGLMALMNLEAVTGPTPVEAVERWCALASSRAVKKYLELGPEAVEAEYRLTGCVILPVPLG